MSDAGDEDFAAMLAEAAESGLKEDFTSLGLEESEEGFVAVQSTAVVPVVSRKIVNGKKFKVRSVDGDSSVCLKFIGVGTSFCLRTDCTIDHRSGPVEGPSSFLLPKEEKVLVILKSPEVAFSSPTLSAASIEPDVMEDWETQSLPLAEWNSMFGASNQGPNVLMSSLDIKQEVEATRNDSFRTPAKRKKVTILAPAPPFEGYSKTFPDAQRSGFKRVATSATLTDSVLELDDAVLEFSRGVERSVASISQVEDTADTAYRKVANLEGLVGSSHEMGGSEFDHPTLWGALSNIGAELVNVRRVSGPAVDLGPLRSEIQKSKEKLVGTMTNISDYTKEFSKRVLVRIVSIEEDVKKLNKAIHAKPAAAVSGNFASFLSAASTPPPVAAVMSPQTIQANDSQKMLWMEASLKALTEANAKLEQRFSQVVADNEADAVKFAGLGLRSLEETAAWVENHFSSRSYGLIFDVYLLFDLLAEDGGATTTKDFMTEMKRRDELDIATESEGQALTAFLTEVPRLFHTTTGTVGLADNASHFSKVPTYKAWANSTSGLKKHIEKKLSSLKMSLRSLIAAEFGAGTIAYSVAVEALEKSITWIGSFLGFLDQTYESLHMQSAFSSGRAWSLTTQLGRRIFSDLHLARMGTTKAMGKGRVAICPVILWSVFRTHDQMAAFESSNFEDHPSIASEYVKFLATNSGLEVVSKMEEEVVHMKKQVKELEKSVALSVVRADKALSAVDVLKKENAAMARKIG
jgi:hypothetical protein